MKSTNLTTALTDGAPPGLTERVRVLDTRPVNPDGRFILYWMTHAMRIDENPALDVACLLSRQFEAPLLVYQGLSGGHAHNNDRSFTFILEGAREVAGALARRGVAHVFHMPERANYPGPLTALARQAAVVVAEEVPAQPFARWRVGLATRAYATPIVLVDTSLTLPMRLVAQPYADVASFREATITERERRAALPYEGVAAQPVSFDQLPKLRFEPVDLTSADIGDLVATCVDLDHGVGPIADAPGGMAAAERISERLRERGFARSGSAPVIDEFARLDAYLHYGMISPMRVAREAIGVTGADAAGFVDDLLVNRELAYSFCFHRPDHDTVDVIPDWARDSLAAHERDHRPNIHDWETLARARTEDDGWNIAQTALHAHAALSQSWRAGWAHAFLRWTTHLEAAHRLALDLYQRFALDGGDPSSIVAILSAFGLFDRPVRSDQPITGAVRPRSVSSTGAKPDLHAARALVRRASGAETPSVAVIGAGLAGLMAARILADHQLDVRVFERARSPGGRCVTRNAGGWSFDAGAPHFIVRDGRVSRFVDSWRYAGVVDDWSGTIVDLVDRDWRPTSRIARRLVGVPGMQALPTRLAESLNVEYGVEILDVVKRGAFWKLKHAGDRDLGDFDAVIVATPSTSAAPLLAAAPPLASQAAITTMKPCWTIMLAFDEPTGIEYDGAYVFGSPLSWIARDSSKPGRSKPIERGESWTLHASHDWSSSHLESDRERVVKELFIAFVEATGKRIPKPAFAAPHRWSSAEPVESAPGGTRPACAWDEGLAIGACGDWFAQGRIESALISGMAVAGRALRLPLELGRESEMKAKLGRTLLRDG